jgi:hypothetical protein
MVASLGLLLLTGCGSDPEPGSDTGSTEGVTFHATTGRRTDAPGAEDFDGVQATVITSQAELDEQWADWEPLGADQPPVEGLGTERSVVLMWAPDHPVGVTNVGLDDGGSVVVSGVREVPGDDCATTAEVTGWTTVVVIEAVPEDPDEPIIEVEQEQVDC